MKKLILGGKEFMPRKKKRTREELEEMIETIKLSSKTNDYDLEDEENYTFYDEDLKNDYDSGYGFSRDPLFDDNYFN